MDALARGESPHNSEAADLMRTTTLTQLAFREASLAWLETRRGHISPRTFIDYGYYIEHLSVFFGEMRLPEISPDMVRAFQRTRRQTAGPGVINKECGILMQMRQRIGLPITDYQALQMPKDWESPGRALTESEEITMERVCKVVAGHPEWKVAALASLLSMKSGLAPCELLSLKLRDISFDPPTITIQRRGAKRVRRERTIMLAETGTWALEQLANRALQECGASEGEHFLFPFQNKNHSFDPTKPGRGYRAGMKRIFELTGIKARRYDLRHHAVSRALANSQVSIQAATAHFGWISPKMISRYFHGALKESRIVAEAIECRVSEAKSVQKMWIPRKKSPNPSQRVVNG